MTGRMRTTAVFKISVPLAGLFLLYGALAPDNLAWVSGVIQRALLDTFGWFYLLSVAGFVLCSIFLIFSRYGRIPLGREGAKPEYPLVTWFAMLFCAGIGASGRAGTQKTGSPRLVEETGSYGSGRGECTGFPIRPQPLGDILDHKMWG